MQAGAQQPIDPEYFSISEGVASSTVNAIIQDSYGILWIGTSNGLQKYDGYTFQTYKSAPGVSTSIQDNYVWGLLEDDNHDIWISNSLGVSKYIREKNEFKNYNFTSIFNYTPESQVQGFRFLIDSQRRLWASSISIQLVQYDSINDTWEYAKYDIPNVEEPVHSGFVTCVIEDRKEGIWIGSQTYGLMHLTKGDSAFRPISSDALGGFNFQAENSISALFADTTNTLWITTKNGVYKYSPESGEFRTFREYHSESPLDVWNNWNCIIQDHQGNVWIANNFRGILRFEGISDRFEEIPIAGVVRTKTRGWNLTLTNMMVDKSGIFWIGSRESGLLKYDPVSKSFSYFTYASSPGGIGVGGVYGLLASRINPGTVYVGLRGDGLSIFHSDIQSFDRVRFEGVDDRFGGSARSIAETEDGTLYIGTWGDGMIRLDKNYQEVKRYKYDSKDPHSISDNNVRVIKPDHEGRFWVGTTGGLDIFYPQKEEFQHVYSQATKTYPTNLTKSIEQLIRTEQVIGIIDEVTDYQNLSVPLEIKSAGTYYVLSVGEGDGDGMFDFGWIETQSKDTVWSFTNYQDSYHAGGATKNRMIVESLDLEPGTYTLHYLSDDSHSFDKWNSAAPSLTSLYGIALIRPADDNQSKHLKELLERKEDQFLLSGSNIQDIEVDGQVIWVSSRGLNKVDPVANTATYYLHDPRNVNSPISNNILDIFRDHRGMIWLATDAGIDMLDPATGRFTHYSEEDGLPTNLTQAILEGENGEIWIATQNGLSQMVSTAALGKVTFINYSSSDGLGGDSFLYGAADKSPDGRFFFGGDHGLTTFGKIASNNTPPSLIMTNLLISNQSVLTMGQESPLRKNLQETKSIALSYNQNNLSFEFAALHYANPQKNQYAHILKGYDQDWSYDNRNFATYTNLDPGKYEFVIMASNAYGIWNEEGKSLEITILPPWWRTWWAYVGYLLLFGITLFSFDRMMRRNIKRREREHMRERELAQAREIEKAYKELTATQSQLIHSEKMASLGELTAGIAHEIQNPLNFVNNFSEVNHELLDDLQEAIAKHDKEEIKAIIHGLKENERKVTHHGKRAESIVRSMLQHSRSGSGEKQLTDLNALCDEYVRLAYHGMRAKERNFNATLKTELDPDLPKINVVAQDMGRVLLNLISNAFQAVQTTEQPKVVVTTRSLGDRLEIQVSDNGPGIPDDIKDKIFQPFFTTKPTGQGTGLGLSLAYDIVKAHGGKIDLHSESGEGSSFIISLPVR